jgi:hypothetical protein
VLQACIRPVVEYASTVWHGTQADMRRLEQVQYTVRVLKRIAATHENVAAALLNVEFGCRTYASWAMQRKLEFKFRLSRMPSGRLPAMHYLSDIVQEREARLAASHCTHPASPAGARAHGSSCYG